MMNDPPSHKEVIQILKSIGSAFFFYMFVINPYLLWVGRTVGMSEGD